MAESDSGRVISTQSVSCPAGRNGIVTVITYGGGTLEYECSAGGSPGGEADISCVVPANVRRNISYSCHGKR